MVQAACRGRFRILFLRGMNGTGDAIFVCGVDRRAVTGDDAGARVGQVIFLFAERWIGV